MARPSRNSCTAYALRNYSQKDVLNLAGGWTGYGSLSAIRHWALGLQWKKLIARLRTIKYTSPGSPNRLTHAVTNSCYASSINTHTLHTQGLCAMGQFELASALTIDCHTGLCFHGHPR